MSDSTSEYVLRRESEAARIIASNQCGVDSVRELLVLECHSSPLAKQYFEERLNVEAMLRTLLGIAFEDYSGDAQMTASYWVSRFPAQMLKNHIVELGTIATNEWDSVAVHARRALEQIKKS
jgi:hypothetical protein